MVGLKQKTAIFLLAVCFIGVTLAEDSLDGGEEIGDPGYKPLTNPYAMPIAANMIADGWEQESAVIFGHELFLNDSTDLGNISINFTA